MGEQDILEREPITCGRELPLEERFCYRAVRTYTYKTSPQLALQVHVHFPHDWRETDQRAAIVFFFGGGLQDGTPEQFTRQAVYLAGRGMVVARANYRVMPKHNVTADRCVADAKSAVRWVRAHAAALGVDPHRVAAGGGSSGGFLAAATGILPGLDEPDENLAVSSCPNLMVLFNPALDIHSHTSLELDGIEAQLSEILAASVASTEAIARSIHIPSYLTADAPPMWIWYGTADPIYGFARPFLRRARELECKMVLQVTEGADHAYFNDYLPVYRQTLASMAAFLNAHGYTA